MLREPTKLPLVQTPPPPPDADDFERLLGIEECVRYYPPNLAAVADPRTIFQSVEPSRGDREIDIFVDVPFCNTICGFCPFNVYPYARSDVAAYLVALQDEVRLIKSLCDLQRARVRTLWVGGGTPSMLEDHALDALLGLVRQHFDLTALREFTVEIKPTLATLTDAKIGILQKNGVNRISMGVQSTDQTFLDMLGRGYTPEEPRAVIKLVKSAGFELNIDMMYRLPGQSLAQVEADVDAVRALGIDHFSWFPYVPHAGTPLAKKLELGRVASHASRGEYLKMFDAVARHMADAGYAQYTPYYFTNGNRCEHHVRRWQMPQGETLGLGAGAFSFFNGWIYTDEHNPLKYRKAVEAQRPPVVVGKKLSESERITRLAVLGIKFFAIDTDEFCRHAGVRMEDFYGRELALLEQLGLVTVRDRRVECTPLGRAFNNDIATVFGTDTSRRTKHPQAVDFMRASGS